jgi:AraC-like DNA-binding protein
MVNLFETIKEHPAYFKQLACKVLLCTHFDCPVENALQSLYSEHNFIVYVFKGRRVLFQPGHTYEMTEGKCIFSKKGGWMSQRETEEGWSVMVFFLPDSFLQEFFKEYQSYFPPGPGHKQANSQMISLKVNETTKSFFHAMLPYFVQTPCPPETLLELKFRELLFNLLINPENKNFLYQLRTIADAHSQSLSEIMDANFVYNLPLKDFAKLAHLSLSSFKREFKKVFKTTPAKWLMQKRLDYASLLIGTSSKSINDIAFESGFENNSHFSRVFRDRFGVSPLQYKKQLMPSLIPF